MCKVELNHLTEVLRVFLTFYGTEKKCMKDTLSISRPLSNSGKQTNAAALISDLKILFSF
jgi:hypothetical protein